MRDIKFRCWDTEEEEIISHETMMGEKEPSYSDLFNNRDIFPLMQYTELKDKNGIEIYEGDIIEVETRLKKNKYTSSVEFIYGRFTAKESLWDCYDRCEVIGNIYENPELLK